MKNWLTGALATIAAGDPLAAEAVAARAPDILRPAGALARNRPAA